MKTGFSEITQAPWTFPAAPLNERLLAHSADLVSKQDCTTRNREWHDSDLSGVRILQCRQEDRPGCCSFHDPVQSRSVGQKYHKMKVSARSSLLILSENMQGKTWHFSILSFFFVVRSSIKSSLSQMMGRGGVGPCKHSWGSAARKCVSAQDRGMYGRRPQEEHRCGSASKRMAARRWARAWLFERGRKLLQTAGQTVQLCVGASGVDRSARGTRSREGACLPSRQKKARGAPG